MNRRGDLVGLRMVSLRWFHYMELKDEKDCGKLVKYFDGRLPISCLKIKDEHLMRPSLAI